MCYPFKDGSPLLKYFTAGSSQCERNELVLFNEWEEVQNSTNIIEHVPLYLGIGGAGQILCYMTGDFSLLFPFCDLD